MHRGVRDAIRSAQRADGLRPLDIIGERFDGDLYGWTPGRDRKMGGPPWTPSSNSTTPASKKSESNKERCTVHVPCRKQRHRLRYSWVDAAGTTPLDHGEGKDREGGSLPDESVHRRLERAGRAAQRRMPLTWHWGQVRDERVCQGAPESRTKSLCLRLLALTGLGFDTVVVAGVYHRRYDATPCPRMLLMVKGNDLSQRTPVRRHWQRRGRVILSLCLRIL